MTNIDERITAALQHDAPPPRDPRFRIQLLERRERQRFRRRTQQAFAAEHDWFHVHRLSANSHFPCLEVPTESAAAISNFVAGVE